MNNEMVGGKVRGKSKLLFLIVLVSIFVLSSFSITSLTTDANVGEFDTMLILGRHIRSQMENRVRAGYDLINAGGNFKKLILTGGCVAKTDGDATCATCSGDCNEATEMEKYLLTLDPNIHSKISIIKETESRDTVANLKKSKGYIQPGEKVLVVSDHRHVRAAAYCLRYTDGVDAYYYYIGESIKPEVPSINLVEENLDYNSMAKNCKVNYPPSGATAPVSSTTTPTTTPPSQTSPQPGQQSQSVTKGLPKSWQEIDEVWSKNINGKQSVGMLVRGNNQIYAPSSPSDPNPWKDFDDVYYEVRIVPQSTPPPSPGGVTPGGSTSTYTQPPYDCSGIINLPTSERQEGIASVGYNSNGKTREQIIIEQANAHKIDPAVIATHATLETNIGRGDSLAKNNFGGDTYCTGSDGTKKSKLTGCGWPAPCAEDCSCNIGAVNSDQGQLSCTAGKYDSFNDLSNVDHYNVCEPYQGIKRWNCLQCVYVGNYDKPFEWSTDQRFFTQDNTCKYAEDFKDIYCQWKNYFAQKGTLSGPSATTSPSTTPSPSTAPPQTTSTVQAYVKDPNCLILYGDSRGSYKAQKKVIEQIEKDCAQPTLIHVADFVSHGGNKAHWDTFIKHHEKIISAGYIYTSVGNHERIKAPNKCGHCAVSEHLGAKFPYVKDQMKNKGQYIAELTSDLILVVINNYIPCAEQESFLKKQIADYPNHNLLSVQHEPIYPLVKGGGASSCSRNKIQPLLASHRAKGRKVLLAAGHTHGLARTHVDGVVHVEAGALTSPRKCVERSYPTDFCKGGYEGFGYYRCNTNLECVAKDINGNVIDSFKID